MEKKEGKKRGAKWAHAPLEQRPSKLCDDMKQVDLLAAKQKIVSPPTGWWWLLSKKDERGNRKKKRPIHISIKRPCRPQHHCLYIYFFTWVACWLLARLWFSLVFALTSVARTESIILLGGTNLANKPETDCDSESDLGSEFYSDCDSWFWFWLRFSVWLWAWFWIWMWFWFQIGFWFWLCF